jgi:hypothetical protein
VVALTSGGQAADTSEKRTGVEGGISLPQSEINYIDPTGGQVRPRSVTQKRRVDTYHDFVIAQFFVAHSVFETV